jgi:diacylglycerol kinase
MSEKHLPDDANGANRRQADRSWAAMFADSVRGVKVAFRGDVNFVIHLLAAAAAIAVGAWVDLSAERWCLVILCIAIVVTAEMINTAIEHLARAVTRETHPEIRDALDVASGAVLVAAIGAIAVGLIVLGLPFLALFP